MSATRYVWNGGDNSDGSTFAKAYTSFNTVMGVDTAGDDIRVASDHAETVGANQSWSWAGTVAAPTKITSVNRTTEVAEAGAQVTVSGSNYAVAITAAGCVDWFGVTFVSGASTDSTSVRLSNSSSDVTFTACRFTAGSTQSGQRFTLSASSYPGRIVFNDCWWKFASTGHTIGGGPNGMDIEFNGGGIDPTSSAITKLFSYWVVGMARIDGFDFSAAASAFNVGDSNGGYGPTFAWVLNCKMPASWSGAVHTGVPHQAAKFRLVNCDSTDTHYNEHIQMAAGTLADETTYVKTGGSADDEALTLSWRIDTTANCSTAAPFRTDEIVIENTTVGSEISVVVDIENGGITLQDDEVWIEGMYLGTSGVPLAKFIKCNAGADATWWYGKPLAAPADIPASSATWGGSLGSAVKQKMTLAFTPLEVGFIHIVVCAGRPSITFYVDRDITPS